jgi:RNA polymerase sigma factor (sigma-70 family)
MPSEGHIDEELLQELTKDVDSTFQKLVELYHPRLHGFVVSRVKDLDLADDILQECWVRIYQALLRYSAERIRSLKLRSWLFEIVQNCMCTELTKKNRWNTDSIEDLRETRMDASILLPDEVLELKNRVEIVKEAVEQLSPKLRIVLKLYL